MESEGMASAPPFTFTCLKSGPEAGEHGGEEADGVLHVRSAVEEGRGVPILGSIERCCGFLSHHAGFCCRSVFTSTALRSNTIGSNTIGGTRYSSAADDIGKGGRI
jgi:hypothetical protein